ncbi:MAG: UDP-N-acetylmuramoyl-L-alanyl-D-glutamate--2,6-diaminopimelate ligase [Clostridia bacterium]
MRLSALLEGVEHVILNKEGDPDIAAIAYDSRKIQRSGLFVCIDGIDEDGHRYLDDAIRDGACCAIVTRDTGEKSVPLILVRDARVALARVSANFHGNPSEKINLMGITGTKGKTTTSYMVKSIFRQEARECALSGTLGIVMGDVYEKTMTTTPQSLDLQSLYARVIGMGIRDMVMEVSSTALQQKRVDYSDYDIGVFTNISRAHIGKREHADFEEYLQAKARLFQMCKKGLVNADDQNSKYIMDHAACKVLTFALQKKADIIGTVKSYDSNSTRFLYEGLGHSLEITVGMPGEFNVYNAMAAATCAFLSGAGEQAVMQGLLDVRVPGRCEIVYRKDHALMIDYAHTPDSLEKLLQSMRPSGARIVTVFGCGGDRDNKMRPMMGEISGRLSDFTIITSDNPRTEDPGSIIAMIEEGMKAAGGKYVSITDRTEAIRYAIDNARPNDLIILAGKGHETYIERHGVRTHYDEREVVRDILLEKGEDSHAD